VLRDRDEPFVVLSGHDAFEESWGPLVSASARVLLRVERDDSVGPTHALRALEDRIEQRRRDGGSAATGIAVLLSFELGSARARQVDGPPVPDVVAIEVDAAVSWSATGASLVSSGLIDDTERREIVRSLARAAQSDRPMRAPDPRRAATSLNRARYLEAVARVKEHILAGDIYQANLTQTFVVDHAEDRLETFARLIDATAAPRAAFVDVDRLSLASVSPEVFLDVDSHGVVSTLPIKGTRPRHDDPVADRAAARELARSEKDRAELLMIVDLERNDLGRICRTGSVEVPELARMRSFPAVHHLVARVRGRLRDGIGVTDLVDATFPGGSISGAPKRRALEILAGLEPWRRGWYTGSLIWLADDGTMASSILIRSVVFDDRRAWLGAGGGIVADSDPELEWTEANWKARALAHVLGFVPEEAG
jgi:anthranilate/para-aminobenzoate synthase component I